MWTRMITLPHTRGLQQYFCLNHAPISMLSTLIGRKKITEAALARALTSGTMQASEASFKEILSHIRTCPHFEKEPIISDGHDSPFILAIMTLNISRVSSFLDSGPDKRMAQELLHEFATATSSDFRTVSLMVKDCKDQMKRLNRPSKNVYYGLAKYIFHAYGLNKYQQDYFRNMSAPNPLFLKEMNSILEPLVWDWEMILNEFKITT